VRELKFFILAPGEEASFFAASEASIKKDTAENGYNFLK
jgi:hypothetical protein